MPGGVKASPRVNSCSGGTLLVKPTGNYGTLDRRTLNSTTTDMDLLGWTIWLLMERQLRIVWLEHGLVSGSNSLEEVTAQDGDLA